MTRLLVGSMLGFALGCTPTPSVFLQFPDAQAEAEGASVTVKVFAEGFDCAQAMASGAGDGALATAQGSLPLASPLHLGVVPRGPAVFFAEVRDAAARPFLRDCEPVTSGGEVLLTLKRLNRAPELTSPAEPLTMREGEVLNQQVTVVDPDGSQVTLAAMSLPFFATFDPITNLLRLAPGPVHQGSYELLFDATEQGPGGAITRLTVKLTVIDVPRALAWDRLYRGWHGRFDAATLYDAPNQQLIVSGGRDDGVNLNRPLLFGFSEAVDVVAGYRVLALDASPADWSLNRVTQVGTTLKFAHVMGFVKGPTERLGFILGGSDGSQSSPDSLLLHLGKQTQAVVPRSLAGDAAFLSGMASAIEADESKTYLFGGDLSLALFYNDVLVVTAPSDDTLRVDKQAVDALGRPVARTQAAMVLAQNPKRLVVIGGRTGTTGTTLLNDAWVLCLEPGLPKCPVALPPQWKWSKLAGGGDPFPGAGSAGVFGHVAGYDAARDRVVIYGGLGLVSGNAYLFEDAFELDLGTGNFRHLPAPGGPLGLVAAASAYDVANNRLLLYGGVSGRLVGNVPQLDLLEDVWTLGLSPGAERVSLVPTLGTPPFPPRRVSPGLTSHGDPILMGGQGENAQPIDAWRVSDGGVTALSLTGPTPFPRSDFSLVYNPDLDEDWLYGGRLGSFIPVASLTRVKADAGFTTLEQLNTEPRFAQTAVYDRQNQRLVVFGGRSMVSRNDTMALSLVNGTLASTTLSPAGALPMPRYGMVSGYDRFAQRMVVFGGTAENGNAELDTSEVWELSLVAGAERWKLIEPKGTPPDPMYLPAGALTAENPPVLYVLGTANRKSGVPVYVDALWKLVLKPGAEEWFPLSLPDARPSVRVLPVSTYDEVGHRLLLTSGAHDPVFRNDVWALSLP